MLVSDIDDNRSPFVFKRSIRSGRYFIRWYLYTCAYKLAYFWDPWN